MFKFDDSEILRLEKDLEKLSDIALPIATGRTLADTARLTARFAKQDLEQKFNLRNGFVKRSVFYRADTRTLNVNQQTSSAGSSFDGLRKQEFGDTLRSKGKSGVPVPTGTASNEGDRPIPKTKLPIASNRRKNIKISSVKTTGLNRRRANIAIVREAAKNKNKFIYLDTAKRKGIYRIKGSAKKPVVKMVWDLTKKTRRLPAKPWLLPASKDALELQPSLYRKHLRDQIERNRLFR